MTIKPGTCIYGGTKDNGVYLLARYESSDSWCFVRADHCWHVVDSYQYSTMAYIKKTEFKEPATPYGGWREIPREMYDERVDEILSKIQRMHDSFKKENR